MKGRETLLMLSVLLAAFSAIAVPSANGLYATIQTTMGNICFELYYTNAPRTVANFVSLAEGSRPWINPRNGFIANKPYYSGLIFHRVIKGFMIQTGSPKGDGTDGPGYMFSDEFDSALRHDRPGIVSMANSGPDSNGGQFFITVAPAPWLDNVHTVFGSVVEGMNIVSNIASVATTNDKPLADVIITNIFISRNGSLAQGFNPALVTPALPVVRPVPTRLYWSNGQFLLDWQEHPSCVYWIFGATGITASWQYLAGNVLWSSANATSIANEYRQFFFNVTEVLYDEFF